MIKILSVLYGVIFLFNGFEMCRSDAEFVDTETFRLFPRVLTDADNFTYYNPNDTYSPSMWVKYGHQLSGLEFATTTDYAMHVARAPIGLFVLGFLSVFFLDWGLLFRCCCNCCKCEPKRDEFYKRNKICNYTWFFILCFLVLLFDQLVFIGNTSVNTGVLTTMGAIDDTVAIVDNMYVESYAMGGYGDTMETHIDTAYTDCPAGSSQWDDMKDFSSTFGDAMETISDLMKDLGDSMVDVNELIDLYAVNYRSMGMWVLWGLSIVSVLFFLMSHFCGSRVSLQLSMFFAQLTFFIYILLGILWCFLASLLGDLCMAPSYNIVKNAAFAQDVAIYYSTCIGSSDIQENLQKSIDELYNLNNTLNDAKAHCSANATSISSMQGTLSQMTTSMVALNDGFDCPPIQKIWFDIINKGLCTELYTGFFYIWGSQLVTSFLLFCLILTAAYTHQFYKNGSVAPAEEEDTDGDVKMDRLHADGVAVEGEDENEFIQNYKKKQAESSAKEHSQHDSHHVHQQGHHHKVVDKNHHLPHQVQVQENDDIFFV